MALANAPGGSRPEMARVRRVEVEFALLPLLSRRLDVRRLVLQAPDILLETDAEGRPNWAFAPDRGQAEAAAADTPASPTASPAAAPAAAARDAGRRLGIAVDQVAVTDGRLGWRDGRTGQTRLLEIASLQTKAAGATGPLQLTGRFALDGTPFTLAGDTGSLATLTDPNPASPWPLRLVLEAAGARIAAEGSIARPLQASGWRLALDARVPELQRLAPLLPDVPMPPLRDLTLVAGLADAGEALPTVSDLRLTLGPATLEALLPGLQLAGLTATMPRQDQPLALTAEATLHGQPLRLEGSLGAPALVLAAQPWPLDLKLSSGAATATLAGRIADPRGITGVDLVLALRVPELAALAPLAGGRPLPPVRDIALDSRIAERGPGFAAGAFLRDLRFASSAADAASPELTYVIGQRRGFAGSITSTRIDLDALRPPEAPGAATAEAPAAPPPARDRRVIPDLPLPLEALRLTDSSLRWQIGTLVTGGITLADLRGALVIQDGRARLDPFTATLPGGPVSLRAAADVTTTPPSVQVAALSAGLDLPPLLAALRLPAGTTGRAEFDIDIRGQGDTLRAVAAGAAGHVGLGLTSAQVEQGSGGLLARLFGDLRRGLPELGNLAEGKIGIACLAGRWALEGGIAHTQALLLDTTLGRIGGSGTANLRDERLAMQLNLDLRLPIPGVNALRIRAPVPLGGTFAQPRPEFGAVAASGLLGTAEGLLRTPGNLAEGLLGALGGPQGVVPGASAAIADCGTALGAARSGRAGPVPASAVPAAPTPAPAAEGRGGTANPTQELLRGLFGRGR